MRKAKAKEMTVRLSEKDTPQISHLATTAGWTEAATIRYCMRLGFAAIVRDQLETDRMTEAFDLAAAEHKIRTEAETRIKALKNRKPKKASK